MCFVTSYVFRKLCSLYPIFDSDSPKIWSLTLEVSSGQFGSSYMRCLLNLHVMFSYHLTREIGSLYPMIINNLARASSGVGELVSICQIWRCVPTVCCLLNYM